jgi:oxygen-independent coproporphyrinogen-3 oxidase
MKDIASIIREKEILSNDQKFNEYIMTSLRTSGGSSLKYISEHWGPSEADRIKQAAAFYFDSGTLVLEGEIMKLSAEGMFIADHVIRRLFRD